MPFTKYVWFILFGLIFSSISTAAVIEDAVPSVDGVPIHYQVQGEGQPALVFVHCWSCDQSYWDAQREHFTKQYMVVTLDLAGHGKSGVERDKWTIEAFSQDVKAVVKKLELEKVILIGHSMGGTVVVETARKMSETIVGVVAVDNLQNVESKASPEAVERVFAPMRENFMEFTEKIMRRMFSPSTDPALIDKIVTDIASGPVDVGIGAMESMSLYDLEKAVKEVQAPIRSINSLLAPTDLDANRRHIKSFEVLLMPESGHFPYLEVPELFNANLDKVIQELISFETKESLQIK